jgi:hypothetical protein
VTPEQLAAIEQRNQERKHIKANATDAPWRYEDTDRHTGVGKVVSHARHAHVVCECTLLPVQDGTFIARARNDTVEDDIDALLDEVRRLQPVAKAVHDFLQWLPVEASAGLHFKQREALAALQRLYQAVEHLSDTDLPAWPALPAPASHGSRHPPRPTK